jgi:hypothetical protein
MGLVVGTMPEANFSMTIGFKCRYNVGKPLRKNVYAASSIA